MNILIHKVKQYGLNWQRNKSNGRYISLKLSIEKKIIIFQFEKEKMFYNKSE